MAFRIWCSECGQVHYHDEECLPKPAKVEAKKGVTPAPNGVTPAPVRACAVCGVSLAGKQASATTCSTKCRVKKGRAEAKELVCSPKSVASAFRLLLSICCIASSQP
jgi:hypothetical protein